MSRMGHDIQLLDLSTPTPTAVVRLRAAKSELSRVVPEACGVVWNALRAANVKGGRHVALYRNDRIDLEVGVELDAPIADLGDVVGSSLPSGPVATTAHFGPYSTLHAAHQAILDFCSRHGHALAGPSWELYGHWQQAWNDDPSQIRTDVCYLLQPH